MSGPARQLALENSCLQKQGSGGAPQSECTFAHTRGMSLSQGPAASVLMCTVLAQVKGTRGRQRWHRQGGLNSLGCSCKCLLCTVICPNASQGIDVKSLCMLVCNHTRR